MADQASKVMSIEEFHAWQIGREVHYELVDGIPVPRHGAKAKAGGSAVHDRIITNIIIALGNQLGDGPCRPATADLAVRTRIRTLRRADVLVTCDEPRLDRYEAIDPRLVVEVISPSNTGVAWQRRLTEYRRHPHLTYILLVDSELIDVELYTRTAAGWDDADFHKRADTVALPALACELSLAAIYRGTGL